MRWCSLHQSCIYIRFIWKTMFSPVTHSDTSHCMLISSLQWAQDFFIQQEYFIPHVLTTLLCLYCTRAHIHTRDLHYLSKDAWISYMFVWKLYLNFSIWLLEELKRGCPNPVNRSIMTLLPSLIFYKTLQNISGNYSRKAVQSPHA